MGRVALLVLLLGCAASTESDAPDHDSDHDHDRLSWPDPLEHAPRGSEQLTVLCAREGDDLVRDLFCGEAGLAPSSLIELQQALQIDAPRIGGHTGLSLTANSTALSTRSVSAINPRLIAMRVEVEPLELLVLGYVRGEQSVELVVRDRITSDLRFYFLAYRQVCNEREAGCLPEDLLTPATESDWVDVSLYDEQDLANTTLDCRSCHQPDGPGTPKLLRMQELRRPWTHWLWRSSAGGSELLDDFFAAHRGELYGGMPSEEIDGSHPGNLETIVVLGGGTVQPNEFQALVIETEMQMHGRSPTWDEAYAQAQRGAAIAVPYHGIKVTDPDKLAAMTGAYLAWQRGELGPGELPDIRDVFPDDEVQQAELGFTTLPGLSGREVLAQACTQCHNARLDQTISRAGFHTDLATLTRAQKDAVIERIGLEATDARAMPPRRIRYLSDEARERLIELLKK